METDGKLAQIEALLRQGVTKKQLVAAGFAESTVRKALKRLEKKGEPVPHDQDAGNGSNLSSNHSSTNKTGLHFPMKLGAKEIIPVEAILHDIRLQDGEYKLGFTDGLRIIMGVQWMVYQQVGILQGLASAQSEITESQLRILREAKSESGEIASKAAQEAASAIAQYFEQTKPWLQASPNPMQSMMANLMKPLLQNLMGRFVPGIQPGQVEQSGTGSNVPPGWSHRKEKKDN